MDCMRGKKEKGKEWEIAISVQTNNGDSASFRLNSSTSDATAFHHDHHQKSPKVRLFGVSAYLPPSVCSFFFGGGVVPLPFCLICSVPFLIDVFLSFLFKTSRWFASSFYSTHHFVLNLAAVGHSLKSGIRWSKMNGIKQKKCSNGTRWIRKKWAAVSSNLMW